MTTYSTGWLPTTSTDAVLLSATVAFIASVLAILVNRATARRRATIEMLMRMIWDEDYLAARTTFALVADDDDLLMKLHREAETKKSLIKSNLWNETPTAEKRKLTRSERQIERVRQILNNYELICIGIRESIYDEAIYRRWYYSTFVGDWDKVRLYVERLRTHTGIKRMFIEYQELADRWEAEGTWRSNTRRIPLWGGRMIAITRSR